MKPIEIRELRYELCLEQNKFAELLGVSRQSVSDWENGRKRPSLANLRKLRALRGQTK